MYRFRESKQLLKIWSFNLLFQDSICFYILHLNQKDTKQNYLVSMATRKKVHKIVLCQLRKQIYKMWDVNI